MIPDFENNIEIMEHFHQIMIGDQARARESARYVKTGRRFVFVADQRALPRSLRLTGRRARLQLEKPEKVLPLVEHPVELDGFTLVPRPRDIRPLACVIADRNVCQAGRDNLRLFVACPALPDELYLIVKRDGARFDIRELTLSGGMGAEVLSALPPGNYSAHLSLRGRHVGEPAFFTAAELALAPLSAKLEDYRFQEEKESLLMTLEVTAYGLPFEEEVILMLTDPGEEIGRTRLAPCSPGRYKGDIGIRGTGPFRLSVMAVNDAEGVAELSLPPFPRPETEKLVVGELGREILFSNLPAPDALPVMGGHLEKGGFFATPLVVEDILSGTPRIRATRDVESLCLVIFNLVSAAWESRKIGDVEAGNEIAVDTEGYANLVFAGCFAKGLPFEGYTLFAGAAPPRLFADVPSELRPGEDIRITLGCEHTDRQTPVFLSVRERTHESLGTPGDGLRDSLVRNMAAATKGMDEHAFSDIHLPVASENLEEFELGDEESLEISEDGHEIDFDADEVPDEFDFPESEYGFPGAGGYPESCGEYHGSAGDDLELEADDELLQTMEFAALSIKEGESGITGPGFSKVLFHGIVPVRDREEVRIPGEEMPGNFVVEAFALGDGGWAQTRADITVNRPLALDLEMPPVVHRTDRVTGRLRLDTDSGKARVGLRRDGEPVRLRKRNSDDKPDDDGQAPISTDTPAVFEFEVRKGIYTASLSDSASGETLTVEKNVGEPGKFPSHTKTVRLLRKGESLRVGEENALSVRLLPDLGKVFERLLRGTADYPHLCCEQVAAKILAWIFVYLRDKRKGVRFHAEQAILSGIAWEREMLRPGRGFALYPEEDRISEAYSRLTVRYLWHLERLRELPDLSPNLREAVRKGLLLADKAAQAHQMTRLPEHIRSMEDAFALVMHGESVAEVRKFVERQMDFSGAAPRLRNRQHRAATRAALAYAAACLVATGDSERGIGLANQVMRHLGEEGRLYSTSDSVAAILMMLQFETSGLLTENTRVRVDGKEMGISEIGEFREVSESLEVTEGIAVVETKHMLTENWGAFAHNFPIRIGFRDASGRKVRRFRSGDRIELLVSLREEYQPGDILHVALPSCMTRIQGHAGEKRFAVDFEGSNALRIPLVVTSKIQGKQHFAMCVRNMFREERASSPGVLVLRDKTFTDKAKSLISKIIK